MERPKVSIIIASYNNAEFLPEAITSVLMQEIDYPYEILIGEDCSTDNSLDVSLEYSKKYPKVIKIIQNKKNEGLSKNFARLIKEAQGDYIANLDADDYFLDKNKLNNQITFLENNSDYGMVCGNAITSKGLWSLENNANLSIESLLLGHRDICSATLLARTDLMKQMLNDSAWYINNNCFFDTLWAFWFAKNSKIQYSNFAVSYVRIKEESDSHSKDLQKTKNIDRRYFGIKLHFLLNNSFCPDFIEKVLFSEYDYLARNSTWYGEESIRQTRAYKIGKKLLGIFSRIKCLKTNHK